MNAGHAQGAKPSLHVKRETKKETIGKQENNVQKGKGNKEKAKTERRQFGQEIVPSSVPKKMR